MSTKELYWKYSLIAIILGLGILLFRQIIPFLGGVLGALTLYILVRGQMTYLTGRRKMRRSLAATLLTAEAMLCFLVPLGLMVWLAVANFQHINLDPQALLASLEQAADWLKEKTGYDVLNEEMTLRLLSELPQVGQAIMGGISSFVVNMFVLVFILYFMLIGGEKMERYVREILPFNERNTRHVVHDIQLIVRSNAIGIPLLAVIQGGVAMLGYWLFGVPNILLVGLLTCVATLIPVVGTGLVWGPACGYLLLTGEWEHALGLALYGLLVISQSDNLIRLIIQKRMADIHPLITIFGVVIGLPIFGFMGIIFGPLLLSLFLLCADIFKKGYLEGE